MSTDNRQKPPETPLLIEELEIEYRVFNALTNGTGITTVAELCRRTEHQVLGLPGIGRLYLQQIKEALAAKGFFLGQHAPEASPLGDPPLLERIVALLEEIRDRLPLPPPPEEQTEAQCLHCQTMFLVGPGTGRRLDAIFCSDLHRIRYNSLRRSLKPPPALEPAPDSEEGHA